MGTKRALSKTRNKGNHSVSWIRIVHQSQRAASTTEFQHSHLLSVYSLVRTPSFPENKECFAKGRFLVRTSEKFSLVGICTNSTERSSRHWRMKWCLMSMCLVRLWWTGFKARSIDPLLSTCIDRGDCCLNPSSEKRVRSQIPCLEASEMAMYSASVEERATVGCFLDAQQMLPPA